jgi:hypothetical protein
MEISQMTINLGLIAIAGLIFAGCMPNSVLGLAAGLMSGGAIIILLISLSNPGGGRYQKRGRD